MPLRDEYTFFVQCNFITGSDAQGCLVVLVCENGVNITKTVLRTESSTDAVGTISAVDHERPLHSCCEVFGFDIEFDGSVGSVAVPGELRNISIDTHHTITDSGIKITLV